MWFTCFKRSTTSSATTNSSLATTSSATTTTSSIQSQSIPTTKTLTIHYNSPFIVDEDEGGPICPPHLFESFISKASLLNPPPSLRVLTLSSSETLPGLTLGHSFLSTNPGRSIHEIEIKNAANDLFGTHTSISLSNEIIDLLLREGFLRIDSNTVNLIKETFNTADIFFSQTLEEKKMKTKIIQVPRSTTELISRHVGYRNEGFREFFALRREDNTLDIPSTWVDLFLFQEKLAEDLFVLISQGLGLAKESVNSLLDRSSVDNQQSVSAKSNVMRVYRYLRPQSSNSPGLFGASTGAHADAGLLTVSPASNSSGLVVLSPDGTSWINVEGESLPTTSQRFYAFLGEQGSRFFKDATASTAFANKILRPPVHFVDEKEIGKPRFSAPFFLRAPLNSSLVLDKSLSVETFLGSLHRRPWALVRTTKSITAEEYASDF
jgi:isopenicillin N synthase-like dioxygenase